MHAEALRGRERQRGGAQPVDVTSGAGEAERLDQCGVHPVDVTRCARGLGALSIPAAEAGCPAGGRTVPLICGA